MSLARSREAVSAYLPLDLLRARRAVPRLYTERVGDGDVLLVVENSDTFDSLVRVLADRPGRVGSVGWGGGGGFEASVLSIGPDVREILYFGDLDRDSLRIPANASRLAVLSGLPPVRPAAPLYDAVFEVGQPQSGLFHAEQRTHGTGRTRSSWRLDLPSARRRGCATPRSTRRP